MKKLFLILVSVLVLGGCSVDDDISVSGGGVSSGGDDMAITTYPNVVEASRTAVEGGYLVDYVFYSKHNSFDFFKYFFEILGVDNFSSASALFDFVKKSCVKLTLNCFIETISSSQTFNELVLLDLSDFGFYSDNNDKFSEFYLILSGLGNKKNYTVVVTRSSNGDIKIANDGLNSCGGRFTIFEPSK